MASETGGRSDKLGNEFERLWAVRHLVELISERAITLQIECLGDDEKGTEFWVHRPNGTREAHQCKRENASKGTWSIAELEQKDIISNAKFQLESDPSHRFVFVSSDKAPHLSDFCERAWMAENATEFRDHSVPTSKDHKREFRSLCTKLKLDPTDPHDLHRVFDFLRRFSTRVANKGQLREEVQDQAAQWLTGDPPVAVAALKDLLDRSIGRILRTADILRELPTGIAARNLAMDTRLRPSIEELRGRFDRSYRHLLIGGALLKRPETDSLWSFITEENEPHLILLHGRGGDGKSGIAFELVDRLRASGVPYLPLRLDRDRPDDSPRRFGENLDLPASPAACLAAAADGELAVLIVDQIDAIRWTSVHSSHAWDTCERLIAEALRHQNIRVIAVCRSFDVEDDPRIRLWKTQMKAKEVKVGPLGDDLIDAAVSAVGVAPSSLDARQRRVLQSPQGLYLWRKLRDSSSPPPVFRTIVDLTRAFWEMTRKQLEALKHGEYEAVIDKLVEYMDVRGTLAAPWTIVSQWPGAADALISMNVLTKDQGRLLFAHQSYLDYLAAERVLRTVHEGSGTLHRWLEAGDQSLFRRGQLRQMLALLRDDNPVEYESTIRSLLSSDTIRFHLKHLILQSLGHANPPTDGEVEHVLNLLDDQRWVDHLFGQVLASREAWFDAFHSRGLLGLWLKSSDTIRQNLALSLIDRLLDVRRLEAEELLLDHQSEKSPIALDGVIWRARPEDLPERLFAVYADMVSRGSPAVRDFFDWKTLARTDPERCLTLLCAKLEDEAREARRIIKGKSPSGRRRGDLLRGGIREVSAALALDATSTWDRLMPVLLRLLVLIAQQRRSSRSSGFNVMRYDANQRLRTFARELCAILKASGKSLATNSPNDFWMRVSELSRFTSRPINRLLANCIKNCPVDMADEAVDWLLADERRLLCGSGDAGAIYRPAYRLLRRYAAHCTDPVFMRLVERILTHRSITEMGAFRIRHDILLGKSEIFPEKPGYDILSYNQLGRGKHILLSSLPASRLKEDAKGLAGVFRRKFGPVPPLLKGHPKSFGGRVTSTIPSDRVPRLSDRHWVSIVEGSWRHRPRRWRQMGPDQIGEANVETFSGEISRMTKEQPRRFARLALKFSDDADPQYPIAILRNLAERHPPSSTKGTATNRGGATEWEPATVEEIDAVFRRFGHLANREDFASAMCWCIEKRPDEPWSDETLQWLVQSASSHPHPTDGQYTSFRPHNSHGGDKNDLIHDYETTSINCVRGIASEAIGSVLFHRKDKATILRPGIEALIKDPHPSVRIAAIGLAIPLLNIDRGEALRVFTTACSHEDDRVLASRYVSSFLRYTILKDSESLERIIRRMASSSVPKVAESGAGWITIVWAHRKIWEDLFEPCIDGPVHIRKGLAAALAQAVANECENPDAAEWLALLFDDPDESVRGAAASYFRVDDVFHRERSVRLSEQFASSVALDENLDDLLLGLEHHTGPLKQYASVVLSAADRLAGPLAAEARDIRTRGPLDADHLSKVLLRLYEQTDRDLVLRQRCLDSWDRLLSERIGLDLLRQVDG